MSVHILPTALARAGSADHHPRNAGTTGIFSIAGRLGIADRSIGHVCRTVTALIDAKGFPAPFPHLVDGALASTAHPHARWPRVAVDCWFTDQLPPAARGQVDQAERVALDSRLSARAATLFAGMVSAEPFFSGDAA